jgi:hypothetical protein
MAILGTGPANWPGFFLSFLGIIYRYSIDVYIVMNKKYHVDDIKLKFEG